jgi:hypothetical protein
MAIDIDKVLQGLGAIVSVDPICAVAVLTPTEMTKQQKAAKNNTSHGNELDGKDAMIWTYYKAIAFIHNDFVRIVLIVSSMI